MVKPNPLLKPYVEPVRPRSPYRPGLPPSMQSKRYKALTEIYDFYKNRIDHNAVKLIGYDSESDLSDYDSDDSDYESKCPDRGVAEWMRHTRNLRDVAPWIRSVSYRRWMHGESPIFFLKSKCVYTVKWSLFRVILKVLYKIEWTSRVLILLFFAGRCWIFCYFFIFSLYVIIIVISFEFLIN